MATNFSKMFKGLTNNIDKPEKGSIRDRLSRSLEKKRLQLVSKRKK